MCFIKPPKIETTVPPPPPPPLPEDVQGIKVGGSSDSTEESGPASLTIKPKLFKKDNKPKETFKSNSMVSKANV